MKMFSSEPWQGRVTAHHRFLLRELLDHLYFVESKIISLSENAPIIQKITKLTQFRLRFLLIQDNNGVIQLFDHKGFDK